MVAPWKNPQFQMAKSVCASFYFNPVLKSRLNPICIPSGKLAVYYGKSQFFMGKSEMAIFNSFLYVYPRVNAIKFLCTMSQLYHSRIFPIASKFSSQRETKQEHRKLGKIRCPDTKIPWKTIQLPPKKTVPTSYPLVNIQKAIGKKYDLVRFYLPSYKMVDLSIVLWESLPEGIP